mgnify:CR=1 FL=1
MISKMSRLIVPLLIVMAIVAAACGSTGSDDEAAFASADFGEDTAASSGAGGGFFSTQIESESVVEEKAFLRGPDDPRPAAAPAASIAGDRNVSTFATDDGDDSGVPVAELGATGGDVLAVPVSALKKEGLDKLEEAILLQAELLELKANPDRPAEGVVIEAKLESGRGAVATVLVQRGTIKIGDVVVAGGEWGRVRALIDDRGKNVESAGPSEPVEVLGREPVVGRGYAHEIAEVDRCVRAGLRESPLVPHDQTLAIMRQLDDVRRQLGVTYPADG